MAATLSVQDYLNHFLFNRDHELAVETRKRIVSTCNTSKPSSPVQRFSDAHLPAPIKTIPAPMPQNYGLMCANVYKIVTGGRERLIYSKRIGHKSMDVFGIFVQDMIGSKGLKASQIDGRMSRGSSLSDISSISVMDVEEGQLQPNTTVSVSLLASRSPSNIGSSGIMSLLDHCKRSNIRITVYLKFAHAYTWDNKYNREGLESLSARGVELSSISFPQILQNIFDDIKENLESFHHLQTCRGTISIKQDLVNQAMSTFRQNITIRSDFYHQDQHEKLAEILGQKNDIPQYQKFNPSEMPVIFSLETYRECILLQNIDTEWGKIKVAVTKVANGVTKEDTVFEKVLTSSEKMNSKHPKNVSKKEVDKDSIWKKVGSKVTMGDLSECEQIVLTVNALISEYNGHEGWVDEITQLHNFLRDKSKESEIYKVRVETTIRYAHSIEDPVLISTKTSLTNGHEFTNGITNGNEQLTPGFPKGMKVECIHLKDILFEMLEDLEDNIRHLGSLNFGRGANLAIEKEGLAHAMGLLNKAIKVQTARGEFSMNEDFIDEYAGELNGV